MGLFHLAYAQNFRAMLDALKIVRSRQPNWEIRVTSRSGGIACQLGDDDVPLKISQFTPDVSDAEQEMLTADILYLPMPFQEFALPFNRFSMSTKMISYLGSGLPAFYHGPEDSAAGKLLMRHQAAAICTTLDPEAIATRLVDTIEQREVLVNSALKLARSQFMLADQQKRFWEPILAAL
jgi:putative NADPH-quinone reductase